MSSSESAGDDYFRLRPTDILVRQPEQVSPPVWPAVLLPLNELSPEVFERLVLEYTWFVEGARNVQLYGRRGQKQYGLDIVGEDRSGRVFVCQARRLAQITPADVRQAVEDYAGPPRVGTEDASTRTRERRFDASRFVLATAARTGDDTAVVDEIAALREEYRGDLDVEVVGTEQISPALRDAVGTVAGIFGPEWARAFCGVDPPAAPPGRPTGFGLLEGPLADLGLEELEARARTLRESEPDVSAGIELSIADRLGEEGYPGHADLHRRHAAEDLVRAGDPSAAFDIRWQMLFDEWERGGTLALSTNQLPRSLVRQVEPLRQARHAVLRRALRWYGQGSVLADAVPALRELVEGNDPDTVRLTAIVVEQAIVDGLYATSPPFAMVGPEPPPQNLAELTGELLGLARKADSVAGGSREWRARLRCAIADAEFERCQATGSAVDVDSIFRRVVDDALAGRMKQGAAAMVHSRAARAHAIADEPEKAVDAWRRAIKEAVPTFGGDIREFYKAISWAVESSGRLYLPDLPTISRAVPNRSKFVGSVYDPAREAMDGLRGGFVPGAFTSARRCIWEARLSGHVADERWALKLFADVMKASHHPVNEVGFRVAAGDSNAAAAAAAALPDWLDVRAQLDHGAPWATAAAATTLAAQADLIPDELIDPILTRLADLATIARPTSLVVGQPSQEAYRALPAFASRASRRNADTLVALIRPHLENYSLLTNPALGVLRGLYRGHADMRSELAVLLETALDMPQADQAWAAAEVLREPGDKIEEAVRRRSTSGSPSAIGALALWGVATRDVRVAARQDAARLLREPVGQPRTSWGFGWGASLIAQKVATLVADGDRDDQPEPDLVDNSPEAADVTPPEVDTAARLAAGPVMPLAAGVIDHFLAMAEDTYDIAGARADAVRALTIMINMMPPSLSIAVARRLYEVAVDPHFGPQDEDELNAHDPLRSFRPNLGGRSLASRALDAASEAYRHAVTNEAESADPQLATNILLRGEELLRSEHDEEAAIAADALATLAGHAAVDLHRLASHHLASVRVAAVRAWLNADDKPSAIPARLATDEAAEVRRNLATAASHIRNSLGAAADEILTPLRSDRSFVVRYHIARAYETQ